MIKSFNPETNSSPSISLCSVCIWLRIHTSCPNLRCAGTSSSKTDLIPLKNPFLYEATWMILIWLNTILFLRITCDYGIVRNVFYDNTFSSYRNNIIILIRPWITTFATKVPMLQIMRRAPGRLSALLPAVVFCLHENVSPHNKQRHYSFHIVNIGPIMQAYK